MSHYAALVLAKKPLEAHQQYKRRRSSVASGQLPPDIELGAQVCSTPCLGSGVLSAAACAESCSSRYTVGCIPPDIELGHQAIRLFHIHLPCTPLEGHHILASHISL